MKDYYNKSNINNTNNNNNNNNIDNGISKNHKLIDDIANQPSKFRTRRCNKR